MKDKREDIEFEFAQELKDFLVIYDYEEFMVWSKIQYESYVRRALGHGATPAVKVITHFNKEDSLFEKFAAKEMEEPIEDKLTEIDFIAAQLEDVLHGKEGERITKIRKLIAGYKANQSALTVEMLKDFFNAGYDYRSSLMPESIEEFGENCQPGFKTYLEEYERELYQIFKEKP